MKSHNTHLVNGIFFHLGREWGLEKNARRLVAWWSVEHGNHFWYKYGWRQPFVFHVDYSKRRWYIIIFLLAFSFFPFLLQQVKQNLHSPRPGDPRLESLTNRKSLNWVNFSKSYHGLTKKPHRPLTGRWSLELERRHICPEDKVRLGYFGITNNLT